jgi:endoglucanase
MARARVGLKSSSGYGAFECGVNLGSLDAGGTVPGVGGTDYGIPTNAELDYLLTKGVKLIRLPFKWERIQPTLGAALDATYLGYITGLVTHAAANGQRILLDVHNYGYYGIAGTGYEIGSAQVTQANYNDLWTRLATVFVGNPGIAGYDIMNEPNMPAVGGVDPWPAIATAVIAAIRAVDTTTEIYCELNGFSSCSNWAGNESVVVTDSANKLLYSAHLYFDSDSTGTYAKSYAADGAVPLTGVFRLLNFVSWCLRHNVRGHIGEMGCPFNDPNWLVVLENAVAVMRQFGLPFNYWAMGPWYEQAGYNLSIEPTLNGSGAYVDAPQMAVLTKFNGTPQPASYDMTTNSIVYPGRLFKATTITFTDHGAGGSFAPSSVTFAAGTTPLNYNPQASFAYTFGGGKNVAGLSGTNDGGLTDPAGTLVIAAGNLIPPDVNVSPWGWVGGLIGSGDTGPTTPYGNISNQLIEDTSNGRHEEKVTVAKATTALAYTFSFIAKAEATVRHIFLTLSAGSGGVFCSWNPTTGAVVTAATAFGSGWTAGTATIAALGSGWYLCTCTATSDTSNFVDCKLSLGDSGDNASYQGDGASGLYVSVAQLRQPS